MKPGLEVISKIPMAAFQIFFLHALARKPAQRCKHLCRIPCPYTNGMSCRMRLAWRKNLLKIA
jgi:hypothetical protein